MSFCLCFVFLVLCVLCCVELTLRDSAVFWAAVFDGIGLCCSLWENVLCVCWFVGWFGFLVCCLNGGCVPSAHALVVVPQK